jgi:hypothetical protein
VPPVGEVRRNSDPKDGARKSWEAKRRETRAVIRVLVAQVSEENQKQKYPTHKTKAEVPRRAVISVMCKVKRPQDTGHSSVLN